MKAMQIEGAYGLDNLKLSDRAPVSPGPGQVRLRMKSASLNYRDLITVMGFAGQYPLPLVPLSDGCGIVEETGPGVTRVKAGDRVAPLFFQTWLSGGPTLEGLSGALGGPIDGCLQESMTLSEQGVAKVPGYLSDAEVACLPCAGLTAWRSLIVEGGLKAGETVVVQGTGGVSLFALQFAKAAGAEVIVTSSSDEKLARAKALGADHLVNYKEHPSWSKKIRELTNGRGADHVVEVGGAQTLQESLRSIRLGGHVSIIGVLSGPVKDLQIVQIMGGNARVQGITVGSRAMFEDMCRALALHTIRPVVDKSFALEDAKAAFATMQGQGHFGKITIAH